MSERHVTEQCGHVPPGKDADVRVALLLRDVIGRLVQLVLRHIDAECRTAMSRDELNELISAWRPHAVLADIDAFERAPEWSVDQRGTRIPCVGLTRKREARGKIEAFDRGVADVIEVPFTPDEIVVRTVNAVQRSRDGSPRPQIRPRVTVGPFEMDVLDGGVRLDGTFLRLSALQHTLLYLFLAHPGGVLGREAVLTNVWGHETAVTSNVVDRHIRDLRVKLGERWREPRFIETVPGEGYRYIGAGGLGSAAAAGK